MKALFAVLIFFLAFGWLALLFSATGLFYSGTLVLSIIVSIVLAFFFSSRSDLRVSLRSDLGLVVIWAPIFAIAFLVSLLTCHFATPTVFGGRDQGSIATSAVYLSQNHNLKIQNPIAQDLFQKYGPGKALNFPGFDYTKNGELVSRFPAGYTSYLASAFTFFGLHGIQYANSIPLFFFLVIFWLILKECFDEKISFLGFLLAATFFPFLWFAKFTLTEIYMLFLVWSGIYFLIRYRNQDRALGASEDRVLIWISLAFFALSALVRIEGMIFFALAAIYILLAQNRKIFPKPKNFNKYLLISSLLLLAAYLFLNFPDLVDSAKNLVKAFLPHSAKESAPSANTYSFLARIFFNYNILSYLILGLAGIAMFAKNIRKNLLKKELLPLLMTFPAFVYLVSPMITLDDPWFLRRFVFAVFPALIFYSIYALQKFFYHKIFLYFTLVVLIAANCVVSWRFLRYSENKNLLPQIDTFSQKYGPDDLVLVDSLASGSGYSLMSEPMRTFYHKNAVYFFNAEDLKYINQDRYKNIYLIAPPDEEKPWFSELVKNKTFGITLIVNNFLEPNDKPYALAENVDAQTLVGIWKLK